MRLKWEKPYTEMTLRKAEDQWGFTFPPDLRRLFLHRKPTGSGVWDWDCVTEGQMKAAYTRIIEGFAFDAIYNDFWFQDWGVMPVLGEAPSDWSSPAAQKFIKAVSSVIRPHFEATPPLIPIFGHRYIPSAPNQVGLPVLSIVQTDIIYYGMNIRDYFKHEFDDDIGEDFGPLVRMGEPSDDVPIMPFWTDFLQVVWSK